MNSFFFSYWVLVLILFSSTNMFPHIKRGWSSICIVFMLLTAVSWVLFCITSALFIYSKCGVLLVAQAFAAALLSNICMFIVTIVKEAWQRTAVILVLAITMLFFLEKPCLLFIITDTYVCDNGNDGGERLKAVLTMCACFKQPAIQVQLAPAYYTLVVNNHVDSVTMELAVLMQQSVIDSIFFCI